MRLCLSVLENGETQMSKLLSIGLIAGCLISLAPVANAQVTIEVPGVRIGPPVVMERRDDDWRRREEWRREHEREYYNGR